MSSRLLLMKLMPVPMLVSAPAESCDPAGAYVKSGCRGRAPVGGRMFALVRRDIA
jgi:hypothetical protein